MTKHQAHRKANDLWGTPGREPGDRYGSVSLRTKKHEPRCVVGYHVRVANADPATRQVHTVTVVTMGLGRTWEEAFEAAKKAKQP